MTSPEVLNEAAGAMVEVNDLLPRVAAQGLISSEPTPLTPGDIESFCQGRHFRAYEKLGAHLGTLNGVAGTFFAI